MEMWLFFFFIIIFLCVATFLKSLYHFIFPKLKLPPGPTGLPLVGNLLSIPKSLSELQLILPNLHAKYGPILTLRVGSVPVIFMAANSLAHKALVQNGAIFADRPPPTPVFKILTSNQHNISFAFYGPNWRVLRRNLISQILQPSQINSYSRARRRALDILISRLASKSKPVHVWDHLQFAMFSLLTHMCLGDDVEESQIEEIRRIQDRLLLNFPGFNILNIWPSVSKILFRRRWEKLFQLFKYQKGILIPLIRARRLINQEIGKEPKKHKAHVLSYVDTLLDLQLPEDNRKLDEGEMSTMCAEFIVGGAYTTAVALQWIMAYLVKYPLIQAKLLEEISVVMGQKEEVKEEDLHKLPYLKAVVLEGLRLHPPAHSLLPHAVREDTIFEGYVIPKNAAVNFVVARMGWNAEVWKDPMQFKPERFLGGDVFDITGSKEIKMMPFSAGRRMCPGHGLAMLHLEYFVVNLVWKFEWRAVDGDDVDLSEKQSEFTTMMKNPLQAIVTPRSK